MDCSMASTTASTCRVAEASEIHRTASSLRLTRATTSLDKYVIGRELYKFGILLPAAGPAELDLRARFMLELKRLHIICQEKPKKLYGF